MGPWQGLLNACAKQSFIFSIRKKIMQLKGLSNAYGIVAMSYGLQNMN